MKQGEQVHSNIPMKTPNMKCSASLSFSDLRIRRQHSSESMSSINSTASHSSMGSLGKDAEDKKKKKKSWVSLGPPLPDAAINVNAKKLTKRKKMLLWPTLLFVLMIVFFRAGRLPSLF